MSTHTQTVTTSVKNKEKLLQKATTSGSLDDVLQKVKKLDSTCAYTKCKNPISNFAIECKYCNNRFCTTHGLQEVHGCGEAIKRDEQSKFLHPNPKLPEEKHGQVSDKLSAKLKQMQFERKAKQYSTKKKK